MTDDTVLEEHNEDPALVQMRFIDDGGKVMLCMLCVRRRLNADVYSLTVNMMVCLLMLCLLSRKASPVCTLHSLYSHLSCAVDRLYKRYKLYLLLM